MTESERRGVLSSQVKCAPRCCPLPALCSTIDRLAMRHLGATLRATAQRSKQIMSGSVPTKTDRRRRMCGVLLVICSCSLQCSRSAWHDSLSPIALHGALVYVCDDSLTMNARERRTTCIIHGLVRTPFTCCTIGLSAAVLCIPAIRSRGGVLSAWKHACTAGLCACAAWTVRMHSPVRLR